MRDVRFFPVTVCVRGDIGVSDRLIIEEINRRINGDGMASYELQTLDPVQFVVEPVSAPSPERDQLLRQIMSKIPDGTSPHGGISLKEQTDRMVASLSPREREVLAMRFGVKADRARVPGPEQADAPQEPEWQPPGGVKRPTRPVSVLPQHPTKRKRKR